jgi:Na+/H+-dicarboxylate symporter
MKARTLIHALSLTVVALCIGLLMMLFLAPVAKSDELEPAGFADAQRAALWKAGGE